MMTRLWRGKLPIVDFLMITKYQEIMTLLK